MGISQGEINIFQPGVQILSNDVGYASPLVLGVGEDLPPYVCYIHPTIPQPVILTNGGLKIISPSCLECANNRECPFCLLSAVARQILGDKFRYKYSESGYSNLDFIRFLNTQIGEGLTSLQLVYLDQGYIPGSDQVVNGYEPNTLYDKKK